MAWASAGKSHLSFVISSQDPYYVDFNHILAFPAGFKYRSRFQRQWIEQDLRQHIGFGLVKTRVLLLLRDTGNNLVIPIRWATIKSASMIGEVAYFEFILGEIIEYSGSNQVRSQEIIDRSGEFSKRHAWLPGPAGEQLFEPAVFWSEVGDTLRTAAADDLTAWGNVVAAVAHADAYERIEFLKIVGLYTASGNVPVPVKNESFVVKPKCSYLLRIFQTVPRPGNETPQPHEIKVQTFSEHIIALPPSQQAVGKYDLLEFSLKVRDLEARESTTIVVPHNPAAAIGSELPADLRIPVAARVSRRMSLLLTFVAAASLLGMLLPQRAEPLLPADLVRNLATVFFVLVVAGSKWTYNGLWPSLWRAER